MVRLNCSNVRFGSELDEKFMFQWAREISGFVDWERDTLVIRSIKISESSLRELLALFWRYKIPMQQLAQFSNTRNSTWFENPAMYWYKEIFGKKA